MPNQVPAARPSWKASRYGFAGFCFLSLLAGWFGLRLVLLIAFKSTSLSASDVVLVLSAGFQRDLFAAFLMIVPLLLWFLIITNRQFRARWHRRFLLLFSFAAIFAQIFLLFVEFYFFEEFKSRFNTVAVDYLLYPYEVFVNIWQSYHVAPILLLCLALSLGWLFVANRLFSNMWNTPHSAKVRRSCLGGALLLALLLAPTFNFKGAHVSSDRALNEVANNGLIAFSSAAWTRDLDYGAFYRTMPLADAYQRVRHLLATPDTQFLDPGQSIRRLVQGDPSRPRLNVVILLEESLGSEFWGCLGRPHTLTPQMDKLAETEGLLFTNIYASGNRTVRGMEGVLASFPPLPGDSIVRRDLSDNVETIARVLKRDGYSTLFLYGGRGLFDGMRSFAVRNGYDEFIEQKHFSHPTFTTVWGVCDEDLFARAIEEFRERAKAGNPFFATILSVSNHKPYTYPKGAIPENPALHKRANAVKYSDHALGQFFRAAKKEPFWTNTLFVVVADHGARVYGKQSIPIKSYEIPLLLAGPAVVKKPERIAQLGCSLDVAPTILGFLGRPYESLFFGRDLLSIPHQQGRAFLNHNRDIGLLTHDRLVVLGLMQTSEFYSGNRSNLQILSSPAEPDRELEKDAIALYQVADDLYIHQRYRVSNPVHLAP